MSINDGKTFRTIAGDFTLSAIAIRLLAPDPESLLRYMPDARPGQSILEWEAFTRDINWAQEAQSVLYVGNFVHEFVHLLQHTTLYQCMNQVHVIHSLVHYTLSLMMELRDSNRKGVWPPQLPLLKWIASVDEERGTALWKEWMLADAFFRLYEGDEEFAQYYSDTIGEPMEHVFTEPFNPRVSHLARDPSVPFSQFNDLQINTKMLLESQATAFEYRFMATFYGESIAQQLIGGVPDAPIRQDYDVLPLLAMSDGLGFLLPPLIDWAFMGQSYVLEERPHKVADYSTLSPSWRFVRLYNAARTAIADGTLPKGQELWHALKDIRSFQEKLCGIAGLRDDDIDCVTTWVAELPDTPLRSVFQTNLAGRKEHPEAYASLEANLTPIQSWTCTPLVMFRNNPLAHYHPGKRLDLLDQIRLDRFAKRIYEITNMVRGIQPSCPFCVGVGVGGSYGQRLIPPVGGQSWGIEGQQVSADCHCGWGFEFKDTWGVAPEGITPMR